MSGIAGHFGEWLQGRLGPDGPVALITLACPVPPVLPGGDGPLLPPRIIARFCAALGVPDPGLSLSSRLPLGAGTGASTAALLTIGRAAGVTDPDRLAAACLHAEGATDPLMLPRPDAVLWAPREGRTLAAISPPLEAEIVGGFFGPPTPTDAQDTRFADISDLVANWSAARSLTDLAAIATASARRCTESRGPADDPGAALTDRIGALGMARAHTGSARAFIFAPGTVPPDTAEVLRDAGLTGILQFTTGGTA